MSKANVIVDELGRLSQTTGFGWRLAPARRVIDTRECTDQWCDGRPVAGAVVHVDLGTDAPAAVIAVTVTDTGAAGFVTVGRCADLVGATQIQTSNLNYGRGVTTTASVRRGSSRTSTSAMPAPTPTWRSSLPVTPARARSA